MKSVIFSVLASGFLLSQAAIAGVCEVKYVRTACAGKEDISYKKCGGKKECTKKKKAKSEADCQAVALKSCSNSRLDITKSKVITATFDGKAVKSKDGKDNFCAEDREDFNKCGS